MKNLKIDGNQALKLYKTASPEIKQIFEDTFGKEFFNQDLTKTLNDWNDILEYSGKKESDILPWKGSNLTKSQTSQNAQVKLELIISVYNQGRNPNITDSNEYKWMFYKYLSVGRFVVSADHWYSCFGCPVGLYMKNENICKAVINNFPNLIDEYLGY